MEDLIAHKTRLATKIAKLSVELVDAEKRIDDMKKRRNIQFIMETDDRIMIKPQLDSYFPGSNWISYKDRDRAIKTCYIIYINRDQSLLIAQIIKDLDETMTDEFCIVGLFNEEISITSIVVHWRDIDKIMNNYRIKYRSATAICAKNSLQLKNSGAFAVDVSRVLSLNII